MNRTPILNEMEDWGYYLLPQAHSHSPGYTGLHIAIRGTPTKLHFDPEAIRLRLRDNNGNANWITLKLGSPDQGPGRVCPGRVIVRDRMDKRVHFFSFGGSLEVASTRGVIVYSLHSQAPILELTEPEESIPDQLACETEALMAELQSRWGSNDAGFAQRLAQVDPLQFYLASVHSILLRYRQSRALRESFEDLYDALLGEEKWLMETGQWPAQPLILEELLAPG
jgi:hypothetical protein